MLYVSPVLIGAFGLTPSPILFTDPKIGGLDAARRLKNLGRVSSDVHVSLQPSHPRAALNIGGDPTGRPKPASFYLLAHVTSADPGRTWISPFINEGQGEVRVNDKTLTLKKRIDKWGGTGDWAEITKEPNLFEVFQMATGTGPFETSSGLSYFTWRTPKATMEELGGVRSDKLPMAGTSRMETRVIESLELLRSGTASLVNAETRSGKPVAIINQNPARVYWFGNERPLLAYSFQIPLTLSNKDTTYTWLLPDGIQIKGPELHWIFPAFSEQRVGLRAENEAGISQTVQSFFGFSTKRTTLDSARDRFSFRKAMTEMVQAYPQGSPIVRQWEDAYWNNMLRTSELGKGVPLFSALFKFHRMALQKHISTGQLETLQDMFLDVISGIDPEQSLNWIHSFHESTSSSDRKARLTLRRATLLMHQQQDYEQAERLLSPYINSPGDIGPLARIRLGDLALLRGDLNQATRYYADVQEKAKIRRNRPTAALIDSPSAPDEKAPIERQSRSQARMDKMLRQMGRPLVGSNMDLDVSDDWKLRAIRDAAASERIRALIDQGDLLEAHEALDRWELDLPLSKISQDFIVLEAEIYFNIHNPRRAVSMLQAFCNTVQTSNVLPEAAQLLIRAMKKARVPDEEIRATADKLKKRLEFHPAAEEIDFLSPPVDERDEQDAEEIKIEGAPDV